MIRSLILAVVLAATPALLAQDTPQEEPMAPPKSPAAALHPQVTLETTLGNIVLELDGEKAPISTKNFIDYVAAGFYDGLIFHRVIANFMIQGGGFTPEMDEKKIGLRPPIKNEWQNGLKNERGTIAMARTNAPDSATAQFFINVVDNGFLDQPRGGAAYAVFGKIVTGLDVVDQIRDTKVVMHPKYPSPDGKGVTPETPVVIKSAKVTKDCDRKALTLAALSPDVRQVIESEEVQAFLKKVETEAGKPVHINVSGLMYVILSEGTGPQPKNTDRVTVSYHGTLLNGNVFDSNEKFDFSLTGGVIKGWLEGVALMKVGEKRKLICPPQIAYGSQSRGDRIPPNSTLVFDVELKEIK